MPETGNYINGSDILLKVDGKAVGHCSTHTHVQLGDKRPRSEACSDRRQGQRPVEG